MGMVSRGCTVGELTMTDIPEQDFPSESKCPECGGEPTAESIAEHRLSALGYLHDDRKPQCEDCGNEWLVGIPVGDGPENHKLWCDSCDDEWMFVHRIRIKDIHSWVELQLHLKCPNCYYFKMTDFYQVDDDRNVALTAYPPITGSVDDADEFGWKKGNVPWEN